MAKALKIYFSHAENWMYLLILAAASTWIVRTGALLHYWYMSLLLLALVPFIEYFTHKYVLHMPRPEHPEAHRLWTYVSDKMHYQHHQNPKAVAHIFAHWWMTLPALGLSTLGLWLLTGNLAPTGVFITTLIAYFLFYEWCHFIAHFDGYTPHTRYGRFMKKFHLWHHYKNEAYWYGITNPLADWIFGKWKDPKAIAASEMALHNRGRI